MRYFVIGFIAWVMLALPGSAKSAEEIGFYRVATVSKTMKETLQSGGFWAMCGSYFAGLEMPAGKIIFFSFEGSSADMMSFAFTNIELVTIEISKKAGPPTVVMLGDKRNRQYVLQMTLEDYKMGLPCLSKGAKI